METQKNKSELMPVREPSKELIDFYEKLYHRNQSKFIRRSSLEPSHLGTEFEYDGKKLTLLGSVDALLMIVKDEEDKYYRLHCNLISQIVVGKP